MKEGHYSIKVVKKLPKRLNANLLYAIEGENFRRFYERDSVQGGYNTIDLETWVSEVSSISIVGGTEVTVTGVGSTLDPVVINTTGLPAAAVANWSDKDFGVWNATSGQFEPAVLSQETGTNVTDTLNQTSGTTWSVNTSTAPGDLSFNWNSDFAFYTQEGNKRYYSLRMYLDNDSTIEFEVTGAKDVVSVQGIGSPLGSGNFANRACFVKREGVNSISLNRDDNNDVDMFVDITFTAIM